MDEATSASVEQVVLQLELAEQKRAVHESRWLLAERKLAGQAISVITVIPPSNDQLCGQQLQVQSAIVRSLAYQPSS